jgi:hypothetical protein
MLLLAADENFNRNIVRGLRRRQADIDIVRIQDVGLSGADDPTVLAWAAQEGRVLLTHDVSTITHYAYDRHSALRFRFRGIFICKTMNHDLPGVGAGAGALPSG